METQTATKGGRTVKDPLRYKTVLCNKFEVHGKCPYGPRCQFAHGQAELRRRHSLDASSSPLPADSADMLDLTSPTSAFSTDSPHHASLTHSPPNQLNRRTGFIEPTSEPSVMINGSNDEAPALALHELTGQVLCKRNASYNTLNVRRTISFLFRDDVENMESIDVSDRRLCPPPIPFEFD